MRVAINGFGRIGRCVLRAMLEKSSPLEVVAINDPGDHQTLMHLLKYDSVHRRLPYSPRIKQQRLSVGRRDIALFSERNVDMLPWADLDVDLVLECSGVLNKHQQLQAHLQQGARRVLVSAPVADADATVVFGVNHKTLSAAHRIISNASCTTNCLAPIAKVIHDSFGIVCGQMTTIHAYTNDQHLVDTAGSDLFRSRAGALSMIPTRTGAAQAVGLVLPELAGKLDGMAVRVPTPDVSIVDLHCSLQEEASEEQVHQAMHNAAQGELQNVLAYSAEPLVSVDFFHHPASAIYDANHTRVVGRQLKVMAWYDNEWGFSNRMVDMAEYLAN